MRAKVQRIFARLPTYMTYIQERKTWLLVLLFGRVLAARSLERLIARASTTPVAITNEGAVLSSNAAEPVGSLVKTGMYLGLYLDPAVAAEILAFARTTPCITRALPQREFLPRDIEQANSGRPKDILAAYYFERVNECPAIHLVEKNRLINEIAAAYIGTPPKHIRTRMWWSFPGQRVVDADLHAVAQDRYHFDLNDFRTLKFFFYLTDVDANAGPHSLICGSHRRRPLKYQLSLMVGHDEEDLRRHYPPDAFTDIAGPAGTGFAEDPFVFHLGHRCKTSPRLILEVEFGPYNMSESYRYGVLG